MNIHRKLGIFGALLCAAMALLPQVASANYGSGAVSCSQATFTYTAFPSAPNNTVSETISVDGSPVYGNTYVFNGASSSHTVDIPGGPLSGNHNVTIAANWNTNGEAGNFTKDFTLTNCPDGGPQRAYLGQAYGVTATIKALGVINQLLVPVNDTGRVTTSDPANVSSNIITITGTPLVANALTGTVNIGGGHAVATETIANETLTLGIVPVITASQLVAKSDTTCGATPGTTVSVGGATIAYLKIGSTLVVGPLGSGAIIPAGSVPANTTVNLLAAKVVLNEQLPIDEGGVIVGQTVNAVHIYTTSLLNPLAAVDVIISHAISGVIAGC